MPSRMRFLISPGAFLALAGLTGCIDMPEEKQAKQPPPVLGAKQKSNPASTAGARAQAPASNQAGSGVRTQPAADSGRPAPPDAASAQADLDAGPDGADSGDQGAAAAGSGGTGGRSAAGSGGQGATGGMRGAGTGGRSGAGGQAGGQSDACTNQLCFTVFDCWLLSGAECNYSECANLICK